MAALLPVMLVLLLLAVSGGADHAPAPGPGVHAPGGPSFAPDSPSESPASPSPEYLHSPPAPPPSTPSPSPAPAPAPAADLIRAGISGDHVAEETTSGGGGGMSGGKKAGIAVGVLVCAAAVGVGAMVYKKRQENIRRSRYGYSGGRVEMF